MKNIKIYSFITIFVTILIIVFTFQRYNKPTLSKHKLESVELHLDTLNKSIEQMKKKVTGISAKDYTKRIKDLTLNRSNSNEFRKKVDGFNREVNGFKRDVDGFESEINEFKREIADLKLYIDEKSNPKPVMQTFWVKVAFSGIFCFAALYIVLSNKYDETTKKWALNALVGIAGVWIGTIS